MNIFLEGELERCLGLHPIRLRVVVGYIDFYVMSSSLIVLCIMKDSLSLLVPYYAYCMLLMRWESQATNCHHSVSYTYMPLRLYLLCDPY